jgi:hypothetical protein
MIVSGTALAVAAHVKRFGVLAFLAVTATLGGPDDAYASRAKLKVWSSSKNPAGMRRFAVRFQRAWHSFTGRLAPARSFELDWVAGTDVVDVTAQAPGTRYKTRTIGPEWPYSRLLSIAYGTSPRNGWVIDAGVDLDDWPVENGFLPPGEVVQLRAHENFLFVRLPKRGLDWVVAGPNELEPFFCSTFWINLGKGLFSDAASARRSVRRLQKRFPSVVDELGLLEQVIAVDQRFGLGISWRNEPDEATIHTAFHMETGLEPRQILVTERLADTPGVNTGLLHTLDLGDEQLHFQMTASPE